MSISDRQSRAVRPNFGMKTPVIVASTANLTLSGTTQTIDGVAISTGRVLAKDQTATSENGIYDVGSGTWPRAKDFDGTGDAIWGSLIPIVAGTLYTGQVAKLTSTGAGTAGDHNIGTTTETISFSLLTVFGSTANISSTTTFLDTALFVAASTVAANQFRFSSTGLSSSAAHIAIIPDSTSFTVSGTTLVETLQGKTIDTLNSNTLKVKGVTVTASSSGTGTLTFPSTTDDVVLRQETQTLTNKTFDTISNTLKISGRSVVGGTTSTGTLTFPSATATTVVGTTEAQTLTNKTFDTAGNIFQIAGSSVSTIHTILDLVGSSTGSLLYRAGSTWALLAPGTSGQAVVSNGAGVAPSYQAATPILDTISSTQGAILYRGAAAWSALTPGATGTVLTSNGTSTAPSFQAAGVAASGAWTFVSQSSLTAVANIDVTNLATGADYAFVFDGFNTGTSNVGFEMLLSVNNSSSFLAANYQSRTYAAGFTGTLTTSTHIMIIDQTVSANTGMSNVALETGSFEITLFQPGSTLSTKDVIWLGSYNDAASPSRVIHVLGSGKYYGDSTAINAVRFSPGSGNFGARGYLAVWKRSRS